MVLIHGIGSTYAHNWERSGWPAVLAAEGRRAVPFELAGHGSGVPLPADGDEVPALLAAVDRLGVRADAVGFSAGGSLLLRAAARRPEAFRRLALLGVGDGVLTETDGARAQLADTLEAARESADLFVRVLWRLADSAGTSRAAIAAYLRRPIPPLTAADLAKVTAPVLVTLGEQDFAGPADGLVAALPLGRLVTLRGTDHFAITADVRCLDAVTRFLAEPEVSRCSTPSRG